MRLVVFACAAVCLLTVGSAFAYPDGAPWGSAAEETAENCLSCHFDNEPVKESQAIELEGVPRDIDPGRIYELVLTFAKSDDGVAGFMASASAGAFETSDADVEVQAHEVRSIVVKRDAGSAAWSFTWRAPEAMEDEIVFSIAANAGNDDMSPFGDVIHTKTVVVKIKK